MTIRPGEVPRIVFCTDTYPPQVNGVSVVTALSVAGMQERGWEVSVVAPRYPKPYGEAFATDAAELSAVREHVRVPSIALAAYPDIRLAAPLYPLIARAMDRIRPHLVHCETEFLLGRLGQIAALRRRFPVVSSYHTDFGRYTESYGVPWTRNAVTRYIARFHRRSRRVYTPSEPARRDLLGMGVRNVEVWGRGVDARQFAPSRRDDAVRRRLGIGDTFMFLHVGRLAPEKSVELVIDAYARFRAAGVDRPSALVIAGDGPAAADLRRRAEGVAGVHFLGNLERHSVLPPLYASADAFVYASETETLGLVVLEAMASGLPVIAAPAGGVADNLRDEVNGLAFAPGDVAAMTRAMQRLAGDEALRLRLSAGARTWAEAKSWHAELNRLDASYREVAAGTERTLDQAVTGAS